MKRDVVKHGLAHKMPGLSDIAWEVQLHTYNKEQTRAILEQMRSGEKTSAPARV